MQHQTNFTVIAASIAASAATLVLALSPAFVTSGGAPTLRVVELPRVVVSAARERRVVELPRVVIQAQREVATAKAEGAVAAPLQPVMSRQL